MNQPELLSRKKQPTEFYEFEGVIRSVTYEGTTHKNEPFIRMKARASTGEIYKVSLFNRTSADIEPFIGRPVRFDYYCSQDAAGTEYKNIDGDIELIDTPSARNSQQSPPTAQNPYPSHSQAPQNYYAPEQAQQYQSPPQHRYEPQNGSQTPQQHYQQQPANQQAQNQHQMNNGFDDDDISDIPF